MKKEIKRAKRGLKETLAFKLLIISLVVLFVLIVVWMGLKISEEQEKAELGGELGTLKWDFGKEEIVLDVLNYLISEDKQAIEININWSSGDKSINAIFIDFLGITNGCNYIKENDLVFGINKTYIIEWAESVCNESDFSNVTNVKAYAQVHINLTQIALIPNITLYNDDSKNNVIDLDNYFRSLVNVSYYAFEEPDNDYIIIKINETTHLVSFIKAEGWYETQKFNLLAESDDGDVLDVATNGNNMSFYVIFINETRTIPSTNHAPEFLYDECGDIEFVANTSYTLEMEDCWTDDDNDSLIYRYKNTSHSENLSFLKSGSNLAITPQTNYNGTGYFYIYANDSKNESEGRVDFEVIRTNTTNLTNRTTPVINISAPKIKFFSPASSEIQIFPNESKTFLITAENYENVKWYLNGRLVGEGELSYNASKLKNGDIIKVEIINETRIDSKTWDIKIKEEEYTGKLGFSVGTIIFYSIIVVIVIILGLIIWLFIVEKRKERREIRYSFGVAGVKNNKTNSDLDFLNIPR